MFTGQLVAVVPQEQLLECGRMADETADSELAEPLHGNVEVSGVDVETDMGAVYLKAMDPGKVRQALGRTLGLRDDRCSGQVPKLIEGAALLCAPARMMLTRSHSDSTSARIWLDSNTVRPSALTSRMQSWNTASISGSRPDVGSSRINNSASDTSAATNPTFCRFPFE